MKNPLARWILEGKSDRNLSRRRLLIEVAPVIKILLWRFRPANETERGKGRKERRGRPISTVQIIQECRVPMEL